MIIYGVRVIINYDVITYISIERKSYACAVLCGAAVERGPKFRRKFQSPVKFLIKYLKQIIVHIPRGVKED